MEERRRYQRFKVYCPLEYKFEGDRPRDYTITLNVCEGGALISMKGAMNPSRNLILRLFLRNEEFFMRSRIIHVQPGTGDGYCDIGVTFLEPSDNFIKKFYQEIATLKIYQEQYIKETGQDISLSQASARWYRNARVWL